MVECKVRENKMICNCSYSCNRKGLCCSCVRYHRDRRELPACYFSGAVESTYDRSVENYLRNR